MADNRTKGAWRGLLLCVVFLGLAVKFETLSGPTAVQQGYVAASADNNTAVMQAAGEFRVVAANLLWAKVVDHYHHEYMAQGGDWAKNESLLPLLRTIITLDPHFVEAYELMGSTILPATGKRDEGRVVLRAGIKNNPNDWELYRDMAMLYAWTEHRPQEALPYAQAGLTQTQYVTDDDGFAKRLMTQLCRTLQRQIHDEATAKGQPSALSGLPRRPAPAGTARQSRPSA